MAAPGPKRNSRGGHSGRRSGSSSASALTSQQVQLSKHMSYLLRHGARKENLAIDADGWVQLRDLCQKVGCTAEQVRTIVSLNDKKRFELCGDPGSEAETVRASQGHSMQGIDPGLELLTEQTAPKIALHGTYSDLLPAIMRDGLLRMSRQHVHMAEGRNAVSGMRGNVDVVIHVDVLRAMKDGGLQFYRSKNGVILCEGPIPPKFFAEVEQPRKGHAK